MRAEYDIDLKFKINTLADGFEWTEKVINNFERDIIDTDQYLSRARKALINAIVFYLYYKRTPMDWEFVRIFNLLNKASEELRFYNSSSCLFHMCEKENNYIVWSELEIFYAANPHANYMTIKNVLQTFSSPDNLKYWLQRAKNMQAVACRAKPQFIYNWEDDFYETN